MKAFTKRFEELLKDKNKNIPQIAKDLDISNTSRIYRWKNGESIPRLDFIVKLADYFGCSISYLIGHTDNLDEENYNKNLPPFNEQVLKYLKKEHKKRYNLKKEKILTSGSDFSIFDRKSIPTMENVIKLAKYFKITIDELIGRV